MISQTALGTIKCLPMMPELDDPPTLEELEKAIDRLQSGKAAGKDSNQAVVIKSSKSSLLHHQL